jgi:RimJ/RimL family protein N-acetyltransferase
VTAGALAAPVLATARLRMRPPGQADAARLTELAGDYAIASMTLRMPHPYALEDAEAFVARCSADDPGREVTFVLEDREAGLVGVLGFFLDETEGPPLATEIGYWIGRPFWGRGYASEAVQEAVRWSERDWGRRLLQAGHFAENQASGRVLEKAGFLYTGVVASRFSRARGAEAATRLMVRIA